MLKPALVVTVLAATQAAAPSRPVPVAANTLVSKADSFYGQVVSVTAPIERVLSATSFVIDQDRAKSGPHEVLVIVPTMTGTVAPNSYVTVVGQAMAFDPAEIASRAKDYTLDLGADVIARYKGRPAILATTVVNEALVDLGKRPPPPLTPEEETFDAVMKRISPAFNSLRTAAGESNAAATLEHTKVLKAAFADAEAFWKKRATADAIEWTRTARTSLTTLERAAGAGNWEQVKTSAADLNRTCQACHAAHRERLEDGTFRVKNGF